MNQFKLIFLLALALPVTVGAQTTVGDADLEGAYRLETYSHRLSCHDPSIVVDNVTHPDSWTYYVYGSHLGHGRTDAASNYKDWDDSWAAYETGGSANSLFANAQGVRINYADAYSTNATTSVKDYQGNTVTFGNFNVHEWQASGNKVCGMQWAPDVIYNKTMKKWCMYMSLNGDHWCSSIVLFTSDNVQGPWVYQGPVVFSGFQGTYTHNGYGAADDWKHTDLAIATGATSLPERYKVGSKWGTYWPNCIDPCVFYDDDDNLWMSYGSWSGGIFMLRLNRENGLRDYQYTYDYEVNGNKTTITTAHANCTSDPYFGKKIAGGYYVSGEGSYIQKIGKHWFLFLSYGGLNPGAGYQMRIFRADKPDGPYKDAYGTPALYDKYRMNYGSAATDNRGVLLMDGYKWDTMLTGETAQGHNSAFIDEKGRAFVVYHTKFTNNSYGHEVRVHQLFLNEDGWLVAAPYEFNGEPVTNEAIASSASVSDAEVPGNYQFIRHQYNQPVNDGATTTVNEKPINIELHADGSVSGASTGGSDKWTRKAGTDFITLSIDGVDYKGVLVKQRLDYTSIPAVCITAVADDNGSTEIGRDSFTYQQEVWASKADAKAAVKYTLDKISIPFTDGATINSNVSLPEQGFLGATIAWTSSDSNILREDGTVLGNGPVTLTLKITKDDLVYTREYSLHVDKGGETSTPVYYPVSQQKNTDAGWWTNFSTQSYAVKKGNAAEFKFNNYSNKVNNWDNWCLVAATNGTRDAGQGYSEYFVLRNDNYGWQGSKNTSDDKTWYTTLESNYNWDTFKREMDGSQVDMLVNYSNDGVVTMTASIVSKSGNIYHYKFAISLAGSSDAVTLFFVSEGSYIDGTTSGIKGIKTDRALTDGRTFNLSGQRVSNNYKGIVVVNGKKIVRR